MAVVSFLNRCRVLVFTVLAFTVASSAQGADSRYKGLTLRFLTSANVHQTALARQLQNIAKEWGAQVEVRTVTTDELAKKVVLDYVAGADTWDLVYTGGIQRMYEWYDGGIVDDIAPLIKKVGDPKILDWDGFTDGARTAVKFEDKVLGLAVATSDQALAYRADLFGDAVEKAAFRAKYGYDLRVPDTYKQYREVAQFFTRKKGDKLAGKVLTADFYGVSYANKNGTFLWHSYENILLAFGVQVYDPKTRKIGLTSPMSIEAANYYKSLVPFEPPGHINMSSAETTNQFVNGQAAMLIEYFDRVIGAVSGDKSAIKSAQVGYAFPPTQEGNPLGRKHAFRSGPAVVSVYGRSKHKEAAYKLLEAAVSQQSQVQMMHDMPGYMPTNTAALKQLAREQPPVDYLVKLSTADVCACTDAVVLPYPSILKASEIGDAISNAVSAILTGAKVEDQLAKVQSQVEKSIASTK